VSSTHRAKASRTKTDGIRLLAVQNWRLSLRYRQWQERYFVEHLQLEGQGKLEEEERISIQALLCF
jgi:hypothetical protein